MGGIESEGAKGTLESGFVLAGRRQRAMGFQSEETAEIAVRPFVKDS